MLDDGRPAVLLFCFDAVVEEASCDIDTFESG